MGVFSFFVFLATISAISHQVSGLHIPNILRKTVSNTEPDPDFSCLSWRFGVETNNIRDWKTVPKVCEEDVKIYMSSFSPQYEDDSRAVVLEAFQFAGSLKLAEDGKDIWIFDIDETSLSDLPFYAQHGYGYVINSNNNIKDINSYTLTYGMQNFRTEPIDKVALSEWTKKGEAPQLQWSFEL